MGNLISLIDPLSIVKSVPTKNYLENETIECQKEYLGALVLI